MLFRISLKVYRHFDKFLSDTHKIQKHLYKHLYVYIYFSREDVKYEVSFVGLDYLQDIHLNFTVAS